MEVRLIFVIDYCGIVYQQSLLLLNYKSSILFHYHVKMAAQPQVDEQFLMRIFSAVDKSGDRCVDAGELQSVLANGCWNDPFSAETVRLLLSLFSKTKPGVVYFEEFKSLWKYVEDWKRCFTQFCNQKNYLELEDVKRALISFGYRLSDSFYDMLIIKFAKPTQPGKIFFDDFIQLSVSLQTLTSAFRHHDHESKGIITIKYEDFLKLVMSLR